MQEIVWQASYKCARNVLIFNVPFLSFSFIRTSTMVCWLVWWKLSERSIFVNTFGLLYHMKPDVSSKQEPFRNNNCFQLFPKLYNSFRFREVRYRNVHEGVILVDLQNSSYPTQPHSIIDNYSFKIFLRFWLAKITRIIHHNQLLLTTFGRINYAISN